MSHLLTTLADRALGITPTIEPVRAPMFGGEPAGYGETAERETMGFVYGDIVTGTHADRPATVETSGAISRTTESQPEQQSSPGSSVQPVASQILHKPSAADGDSPFTRSSNGQQQSHDSIDSSVLVASQPRLTEVAAAEPEPSAIALSPVTSQASRSIFIDSHSPAVEQGAKAADIFSERSASSDPLAPAPAEPILRPRDLNLASFSTQSAIDTFPQEMNNAQTRQPTIKVTIGRIEVRVVTTPPARQLRQRKKPQPSLSLDDYLKQRAEGRR